jgi:hypothetical protein
MMCPLLRIGSLYKEGKFVTKSFPNLEILSNLAELRFDKNVVSQD